MATRPKPPLTSFYLENGYIKYWTRESLDKFIKQRLEDMRQGTKSFLAKYDVSSSSDLPMDSAPVVASAPSPNERETKNEHQERDSHEKVEEIVDVKNDECNGLLDGVSGEVETRNNEIADNEMESTKELAPVTTIAEEAKISSNLVDSEKQMDVENLISKELPPVTTIAEEEKISSDLADSEKQMDVENSLDVDVDIDVVGCESEPVSDVKNDNSKLPPVTTIAEEEKISSNVVDSEKQMNVDNSFDVDVVGCETEPVSVVKNDNSISELPPVTTIAEEVKVSSNLEDSEKRMDVDNSFDVDVVGCETEPVSVVQDDNSSEKKYSNIAAEYLRVEDRADGEIADNEMESTKELPPMTTIAEENKIHETSEKQMDVDNSLDVDVNVDADVDVDVVGCETEPVSVVKNDYSSERTNSNIAAECLLVKNWADGETADHEMESTKELPPMTTVEEEEKISSNLEDSEKQIDVDNSLDADVDVVGCENEPVSVVKNDNSRAKKYSNIAAECLLVKDWAVGDEKEENDDDYESKERRYFWGIQNGMPNKKRHIDVENEQRDEPVAGPSRPRKSNSSRRPAPVYNVYDTDDSENDAEDGADLDSSSDEDDSKSSPDEICNQEDVMEVEVETEAASPPKKKRTVWWCSLGCDDVFPSIRVLKAHVKNFHGRDPSRINKYNYVCWNLPIAQTGYFRPDTESESEDD